MSVLTPPASHPSLDDQQIADYLLQHPDFFIRNAALVAQMRIPHPVRGSVSLVEWHMARARHQISELEQGIGLLMEQANTNQHLFYRLLKLQARLACASSLHDLLYRLQRWAQEMGLITACVRLFTDRWQLHAPLDLQQLALDRHRFEPVRLQHCMHSPHYLGTLNGAELDLLLPPAPLSPPALPDPSRSLRHLPKQAAPEQHPAKQSTKQPASERTSRQQWPAKKNLLAQQSALQNPAVGSVALSLLGENADLGVLLFASQDPHHYQADQGTHLLQELALLLPDLLQRWVARQ